MGTRNITIIKYEGKERVRQYGQWDGYPTCALANIVDFLKTEGAIEKLKANLPKVVMVPEEYSIYPREFDEICKAYYKVGYHKDINELKNALAEKTGFDKSAIFKYFLATRDTGYQIPNVLIMEEADNAEDIVVQKAYTDKLDWQIEAVNVIDLDRNVIRSYWSDSMKEWAFDALPDETEIEVFERK
jgi:hypothetical protein